MNRTSRRRTPRPRLRELADRLGIIPEYVSQTGSIRRASDDAREAVLAVMGFDAPTEDAARGWLDALDDEERNTILEPVRVVRRDARDAGRVHVRLPPGAGSARVKLTLTEETGHVWRVTADARRSVTLQLPTRAAFGYHNITVEISSPTGEWHAEQALIVVPNSCRRPQAALSKRKVMGVFANLYAMRREHDWGVGDLCALTQLVEWAGARGAAFVGVNPLHALFNRGTEISPYSPVSRLFRNHIYIDVDAVPSVASRADHGASASLRAELSRLRESKLVDYDRVIAIKERILMEGYRGFRSGTGGSDRAREFHEFVRLREPELTRYATWMTIAENAGSTDWRQWPESLRNPESGSVPGFQQAHAERIDFHRWLQFEMHRQLGHVAVRARNLGMAIGVYQDLAIGTNPGGSDTWSYPDLFLTGATVGAPPDPYSDTGQDWGLPPIDPRALRRQHYRYWIQLLRRAFEHSGALRIDHIMGLFRMFWIPAGGTGPDGVYVRYPSRDLLGILALESVRHDAIVVGEDLGTVPKDVPPAMRKWGVLSSRVLYFERKARGFRPAREYPRLALATANTHDMAPLAGFWSGRDIELRAQTGLLATPQAIRREERARAVDRKALLKTLRMRGPNAFEALEEARFARRLTRAVHDFLCSTRSQLVGLSLDDLIGERDPVNVPGVGPEKHPSWRRRNRMTMEELGWNFEVDEIIRCESRRERTD